MPSGTVLFGVVPSFSLLDDSGRRAPAEVDKADTGAMRDCPGESSVAVTCWYWPTLTYPTASSCASTSSTKSLIAGVGAYTAEN